jgi:hypothetical protein
MWHSNKPPTLTPALLALTLTLGCADDGETQTPTTGEEEVGDDTGPEETPPEVCKPSCQECEDISKDAYACMAFDEWDTPISAFSCIVCDNDGAGYAAVTCETQASLQSVVYASMEAQVMPCEPTPTMAADCVDWSPVRHVHPISDNEWDVERELITALVTDPSQLVGCDAARVKLSNGSYQVTSLDSDDLLARLGLENGDVIQSINGHAIGGPADVMLAFFNLWPDTRVFTLSVLRPGVGALTFTYNLV